MNGDGINDVISGCYSSAEEGEAMAGLFYVIQGKKGGGFSPPKTIGGDDGKPLIVAADPNVRDPDLCRICTRPFAADLNGDGHLDLLVGNFGGDFRLFLGKGKGGFSSKSSLIHDERGKVLRVPVHSDPVVVDWDGDGDLDIVSGSASGGAFLMRNVGDSQNPKFQASEVLIKPIKNTYVDRMDKDLVYGDSHIRGPQGSTRVWVADLNGDERLDIILGDAFTYFTLGEGLEPETARAKVKEAENALEADEVLQREAQGRGESYEVDWEKHFKAMDAAIKMNSVGSVWVAYQK